MGTVLAPTIRMMDKSGFRTLGGNGPKKRLADQILRHTGSHGIADDLPSAQILVSGKIEPTLFSLNIGDVAQPDLARSLRLELLSQEVLSHRQGVSGVGRRLEPPHLPAAQAELPAQALDTTHSGLHTVRVQILLQALRSVSFPRSPVRGPDLNLQPRIFKSPTRRWTLAPGMITTGGYPENSAQQRNWIVRSHTVYRRVPCSDSLAGKRACETPKYAAAFFKMSQDGEEVHGQTAGLRKGEG